MLDGVPVYSDAYVPLYAGADRWTLFRWRWFWRFLGKPYPRGPKQFWTFEQKGTGVKSIAMNPALFAELQAEMERKSP